MRQLLKHRILTILLLTSVMCCVRLEIMAQNVVLTPEQIDIDTFDPSLNASGSMQELEAKAYEAYNKADYINAAKYYLAYLQADPNNAGAWYNLSCTYGLLGKGELASRYLKVAYRKGFTDVNHIMNDPDFTAVKEDKLFTNALDSLQTWSDKRAEYQGKMEYFPSRHYLPYWIHLPKTYDPDKEYTLLIGMHGFGDKAYAFTNLWRYLESDKVIFVIPEAPYPFVEGNEAAFSWGPFVPMESKISENAFGMVEEYITELADKLRKSHKIKQTWLMGFSQGAFMGYMLAIKNPDVFDGLIACGGGLVTEVFKEKDYIKGRKLKVLISHGLQDKVVAFDEGQKAFDILKSKGYDVTFDTFEGAHRVNPDAMKLWLGWLK